MAGLYAGRVVTVPALQGKSRVAAFLKGDAGIHKRLKTLGLEGLNYVLGFRVCCYAVHFAKPASETVFFVYLYSFHINLFPPGFSSFPQTTPVYDAWTVGCLDD